MKVSPSLKTQRNTDERTQKDVPDADPETAPMTRATLPHSSSATNLRRRQDVERCCASEGGIK